MNDKFYQFLRVNRSVLFGLWMGLSRFKVIREYFENDFEAFALEVYVNLP